MNIIDFIDKNGSKYYFKKRKWYQVWKPKYKRHYLLTLIQIAKMSNPDKTTKYIKEVLERPNPLFDELEFIETKSACLVVNKQRSIGRLKYDKESK